MSDHPAVRAPIAILLAMTAVTGIINAVGYFALGHVFTANMTGNLVLLGFAFADAPGLSISLRGGVDCLRGGLYLQLRWGSGVLTGSLVAGRSRHLAYLGSVQTP